MPKIVSTDAHVQTVAPGFQVGYQAGGGFVADLLAPPVKVEKNTGRAPVFPRSAWARDESRPRSAGGRAAELGFDVDLTLDYRCETWACAVPADREVWDNADFDLGAISEAFVTEQVQLGRERRVSELMFTASNWQNSATLSGENQWSETGSSVPLSDLKTAVETVADAIGRQPNMICMGRNTTRDFCAHPTVQVLARGGRPIQEVIANRFRVASVIFAESTYCTSKEGVAEASATYAACWAPHCFVGYIEHALDRLAVYAPSAALTMRRDSLDIRIRRFLSDSGEVESVEAQVCDDELVTSAAGGYLIVDATV